MKRCFVLFVLLLASSAFADTVYVEFGFQKSGPLTVGSGVTLNNFGNLLNIVINQNSVQITFTQDVTFTGYSNSVGPDGSQLDFYGIREGAGFSVSGVPVDSITFAANGDMRIMFSSITGGIPSTNSYLANDSLLLSNTAVAPEPSSLLLLSASLPSVWGLSRIRRRLRRAD